LLIALSSGVLSANAASFAITPVSVPDTASGIALLGMSFVALVAVRRKLRR
jgi:hypothetical protein